MKCPHCLTAFKAEAIPNPLGDDNDSRWILVKRLCPECNKFILTLIQHYDRVEGKPFSNVEYRYTKEIPVYPKTASRAQLSSEIPEKFTCDYSEACLVLSDSPKASAALSRRCLQLLLRDEAKVKPGNLADEIQQVIDSGKLPSHLSESLDAVRNIGNFAAHPLKSKSTGEIIEVEPGEAEWNLDVLESLFDFYFVQPAIIKQKRDALNAKLKDAGKPEMK